MVDQDFCQALTAAAGGKLYNVVVESEKTGKALLEKGRLQKAVTFIPLNKITPKIIQSRKIAAAKRVAGKDNVWWARDLVRCDEAVNPAIDFLFGGALICRDLDIATKVKNYLT